MKRYLIIIAAVVLLAGTLGAQTVVGSKHDLSSTGPGAQTNVTRVCVFCHTPHQASTAQKQDPLWNHTMQTTGTTYGVYGSDTLDAVPTEIGGFTLGSASVSILCLSCHDGSVAVHSVYNAPNESPINNTPANITIASNGSNVNASGIVTGLPLVGTDLTNDHPINFTYNTALSSTDGELKDPASDTTVAGLLFGGSVQCASCHDPHDKTYPPFLRIDNTSSGLCTTCHSK